MPPSPKRSAAQISSGIGAYRSAGEVSGPACELSNASHPTMRMPSSSRLASAMRTREALNPVLNWWTPIRIAGTSTIVVTALELLRLRHSTQYSVP
jgi:hypothetical protein